MLREVLQAEASAQAGTPTVAARKGGGARLCVAAVPPLVAAADVLVGMLIERLLLGSFRQWVGVFSKCERGEPPG